MRVRRKEKKRSNTKKQKKDATAEEETRIKWEAKKRENATFEDCQKKEGEAEG